MLLILVHMARKLGETRFLHILGEAYRVRGHEELSGASARRVEIGHLEPEKMAPKAD